MKRVFWVTVHKNGSSLAIVIPKAYCQSLGIKRGDQLLISNPRTDVLQFRPVTPAEMEKVIKF